MKRLFTLTLLLATLSLPLCAAATSAFQAKALAEKQVSPAFRNKVVSIVGPRSETETLPDTWILVFFDPNARQCGRQITVTRGSVSRIQDGYTEIGKLRIAAYKEEEAMNFGTLKVDSVQALDIIRKAGQFKGVDISSVTCDLRLQDEKPVWKMTILADRNGSEVNVGYGRISAVTGEILQLKLDLEKARK
jgi:hypothetical protein